MLRASGQTPPDDQTPEVWATFRDTFPWNGSPLSHWQLWGLLRGLGYSEECVHLLADSVGFTVPVKAPINAGDAFQFLADVPKDPTCFTVEQGFSTLPDAVRTRRPR